MVAELVIDTAYDMRLDSKGRDPDSHSPTLRRYHRLLWSKPLPDGTVFALEEAEGAYLHHRSDLGEFWLSSDSVVHTYSYWSSMSRIIDRIPAVEQESFTTIAYTIGGMLIFPSYKVDGMMTINGARGFNSKIRDRIDLTLECIRRHYAAESSPIAATLARYRPFFDLFDDFQTYVNFFLLDDLVTSEGKVRFLLPFDDFARSATPLDLAEYVDYRSNSIEFVRARNERIARWSHQTL